MNAIDALTISADHQWLARRLHLFFPDIPSNWKLQSATEVEQLVSNWMLRYAGHVTEQSLAAGSWLMALSWLVAMEPPTSFSSRWYEQIVTYAQEHPGAAIGAGVANALALQVGGDPFCPPLFRLLILKAVMALPGELLHLIPGSEALLLVKEGRRNCWVVRHHDGRWQLSRLSVEEIDRERDWAVDFSRILYAIERLVWRFSRLVHEGQQTQLWWWGLVALLEQLRLAGRRAVRQLVNQSATVVCGWQELLALAAGQPSVTIPVRVIECSDLAVGARLLFPLDAPGVADGDLLAVRLSSRWSYFPSNWMVGIIRWQLAKAHGTLVGAQLLAPLGYAVQILTDARQDRGGVDVQPGLYLFRQLPRYPQPLIVVPRAEHLSGRWWLIQESPLFTLQVRRFQPGRIHLVTPHAAVFDFWPKEG